MAVEVALWQGECLQGLSMHSTDGDAQVISRQRMQSSAR